MGSDEWVSRAACLDAPVDAMFVRGAAQQQAKKICRSCPVRRECLVEALQNDIEWGVWGGTTERERRILHRRGGDPGTVVDQALGLA